MARCFLKAILFLAVSHSCGSLPSGTGRWSICFFLKIIVDGVLRAVHAKAEERTDVNKCFCGRYNGFAAQPIVRIVIAEYLARAQYIANGKYEDREFIA